LITSASLEKLKPGGASIGDDFDAVVHMVGAGPLTSNSKFTSAIFDLNYQTTCNLVRLLEITHKLDSLALLVNFSSLAAMGTPRSHAHPSAPASVILNVPIRTRWNAEFRCDHDGRELTCVVTNLKHGKEESDSTPIRCQEFQKYRIPPASPLTPRRVCLLLTAKETSVAVQMTSLRMDRLPPARSPELTASITMARARLISVSRMAQAIFRWV